MRLWRLDDPCDSRFAQGGARGTWTEPTRKGVCPECGSGSSQRIAPLRMVWETGSDVIGDFVWTGHGPVVTEPVLRALEERFSGIDPWPVEMFAESPQPKRKKRVALPYEGPPLFELHASHWVHADLARSTTTLEWRCSTCGRERWKLTGAAHYDFQRIGPDPWDSKKVHVPRTPGEGIFVHEGDLKGHDFIVVHEARFDPTVTDRVRDFILSQEYSNVSFLEMGEVIPD